MTSTNPMAPEAPDHIINEASIHASLFRTTNIDAELELSSKYGLRQRLIDPAHVHLGPEGESIAMWRDPMRTVEEMKRFSRRDAAAWVELSNTIAAATAMGLPLMQTSPVRPEMSKVLKTLRAVGRGRKELLSIARWVVRLAGRGDRGALRAPDGPRPTDREPAVHALRRRRLRLGPDLPRRAAEVRGRDVRGRHGSLPGGAPALPRGGRRQGPHVGSGREPDRQRRPCHRRAAGERGGADRRARSRHGLRSDDRPQQDAAAGNTAGEAPAAGGAGSRRPRPGTATTS